MKKILFLFSLLIFFSACEEQTVEIPEFVPPTTGRVVLVEELTGASCPNCPAGSERLASMLQKFPNNLVVVGIHGGFLSQPLSISKYDLRSDAGVFLDQFLQTYIGKPSAYFNRIKYEEWGEIWGNPVPGQWEGYLEDELERPQVLEISIAKSYNPDTRVLDITVGAVALEDLEGEFKLTIMLTESEIVDAQDDLVEIIEDYVHNHVLRDIITNFDGDVFAGKLEKDKAVTKKYTYTVPSDENGLWNDDHIEIVAFVANTEGESEEVLQVTQAHLKD
jgi:hypothetical protein